MIGGSADWYWEKARTSFRVETSYTTGEEYADTSQPDLYSDSDVFRGVIGFDRPTFIPWLNKDRAFLVSGQVFYQRLLDHMQVCEVTPCGELQERAHRCQPDVAAAH